MFTRILRVRGIIPVLLILGAAAYWWLHPRPPKTISNGYIADRNATLWNTLAQVRQPIADMHYGERVEVVRQEGAAVQLRTTSGTIGWLLDNRQLMDTTLWQRSENLLDRARAMPVQARGQTKTVSNVRIEPGREGRRIFQFTRGTPVVVLERTVADAPPSNEESAADEKGQGGDEQKPRQEDWLLVLRAESQPPAKTAIEPATSAPVATPASSADPVSGAGRIADTNATELGTPAPPIAGWVLARFIEPALPGPVRDYASSADLHVVAWFELNRVPDGAGGESPQYLVAGSRGGEGQPCDFTMLRVYTWGATRKRYETAYVESDLCGHLPIRVSATGAAPVFRFAETGETAGERTYIMQQTMVRRVKDNASGVSGSGQVTQER